MSGSYNYIDCLKASINFHSRLTASKHKYMDQQGYL